MTSQLQSRRSRGRTQIPPVGTRGRGKLTRVKALHPESGVYCVSPKARAGKHRKLSQMERLATARVLLEALFSFYMFWGHPVVHVFQQTFQNNWSWSDKCTNTIFREVFPCAKFAHPDLAKPSARKKERKKEQHRKGAWGAISSLLHVDNFNRRDISTFLRLRVYSSQMPRLNILIVWILLSVVNL